MPQHPCPRDRRYAIGAVILSEETAGSHLYIITRGRVRVVKRSRRGVVILGELGPGNLFGEMALIDRRLRSASVVAVEETVCIELSQQLVTDLLARADPWVAAILRILVLRLRAADTALAGLRSPEDGTAVAIDKISERHLRRIVRELEESSALDWERIAAKRSRD